MCKTQFKYFLLSVFFVFTLQNAKSQNKIYKKYTYPDGTVSSEGYIENGKPNGYWKTYYPTGILKTEGNRKNFELDSIWKFYRPNGDLKLEISYKNGKKNGIYRKYSDSCNVIEETPYVMM